MPSSVTSNLASVIRAYQGLPLALSPRRRLPGGRYLGDEMADTVTESVRHRTADLQQGPDGAPLPALNVRYKRRKIREGYDSRILIRTGEMLSSQQLRGRVTKTSDLLVMAAAIDEYIQQLVDWNTRGNRAQNRPPRRFYELGRDGKLALGILMRESRDSAIVVARRV